MMKLKESDLSGFFSKGVVAHGVIKKNINFYSKDEKILYYDIFQCTDDKVWCYYNKLNLSGVVMPKLLECKDMGNICTLRQEYVIGTKFVDWIKNNNIIFYLEQHLEFFDILLGYQFYSYCLDNRLRIDFNLKNFIMKDHKLYLVDIMPPIFIDYDIVKNGKVYSEKISQLMDLYMNIDHQIIGMIGYWILDSLDNLSKVMEPYRRQKISAILMKFIEHANTFIEMYECDICRINRNNIYNYADNYFFNRLYLLYEYIDNKIRFEDMMYLYNKRIHLPLN